MTSLFALNVQVISKILKFFKSFSQTLEQFFLTVGQNNFGKKIPYSIKEIGDSL